MISRNYDPYCCGMLNYTGFGDGGSDGRNPARYIRWTTEKKIEEFKKIFQHSYGGHATLNHVQYKDYGWDKVFKALGWKVSGFFTNKNSGNVVYILNYTP